MSSMHLGLRATRMLLADWFARLAREAGLRLNQYGSGNEVFTLGAPNEFNGIASSLKNDHSFGFPPATLPGRNPWIASRWKRLRASRLGTNGGRTRLSLNQIVDHVLLVAIDPSSDGQKQQPQG